MVDRSIPVIAKTAECVI
jgi:hypothetical protein